MIKVIPDINQVNEMVVSDAIYAGTPIYFVEEEAHFCIQKSKNKFGFSEEINIITGGITYEANTEEESIEKAIADGQKVFILGWTELFNKFSDELKNK